MQDEHWMEAQRKRIKEAFALFDKDKKGGPCYATRVLSAEVKQNTRPQQYYVYMKVCVSSV